MHKSQKIPKNPKVPKYLENQADRPIVVFMVVVFPDSFEVLFKCISDNLCVVIV